VSSSPVFQVVAIKNDALIGDVSQTLYLSPQHELLALCLGLDFAQCRVSNLLRAEHRASSLGHVVRFIGLYVVCISALWIRLS